MARRRLEGRQSSSLLEGAVCLRVLPDFTNPGFSDLYQSDSPTVILLAPLWPNQEWFPGSFGSGNRLPIIPTSFSTDVETNILTQLPSSWKVFGERCQSQGLDPCTPSIPVIADFLLYCFEERGSWLCLLFKGYNSSLSQVMGSRGIIYLMIEISQLWLGVSQ